jgi:hypothetical protein
MKDRPSKLDAFAEQLEQWFELEHMTLAEAGARLHDAGCDVSLSRLSKWWMRRQGELIQDRILERIATGAQQCQEVEKQLAETPAPELDTLIKLHRVLIFRLSTEANANPELLELVDRLMKPVLGYYKLEDKRRETSLAERKYRDAVAEKKAVIERELERAKTTGGISAETLTKIEAELKLL